MAGIPSASKEEGGVAARPQFGQFDARYAISIPQFKQG